MKLLYAVCFLLVLSSCRQDDVTDSSLVRKIAWNSLSANEKSTVTTQWQDARVTTEVYQNTSVYAVLFNTVDDPLLGPIIVYVSKPATHVVGYAPRF